VNDLPYAIKVSKNELVSPTLSLAVFCGPLCHFEPLVLRRKVGQASDNGLAFWTGRSGESCNEVR
jgi:hypothetical protein